MECILYFSISFKAHREMIFLVLIVHSNVFHLFKCLKGLINTVVSRIFGFQGYVLPREKFSSFSE